MRGKTLADELVTGTLVVVHTREPPAPEEWATHCAGIAAQRAAIQGVVVLAHGPGPNARQRRELQQAWLGGRPPRVAVMTHSVLIQGVLTALNWFMANRLKPFAAGDFRGAFEYLQIPQPEQTEVLVALRRLAAALAVPVVQASADEHAPR